MLSFEQILVATCSWSIAQDARIWGWADVYLDAQLDDRLRLYLATGIFGRRERARRFGLLLL